MFPLHIFLHIVDKVSEKQAPDVVYVTQYAHRQTSILKVYDRRDKDMYNLIF